MRLQSTSRFDRRLKKKLKNNNHLKKQVGKQLKKLQTNPKHTSLKLHKLEGKRAREYSIYIENNLRITFQIIDDVVLLTDIITHDEY